MHLTFRRGMFIS